MAQKREENNLFEWYNDNVRNEKGRINESVKQR